MNCGTQAITFCNSDTLALLDASRDDLNATKEAQDSSRRRAVVTSLLALLGILVAVWRIMALD